MRNKEPRKFLFKGIGIITLILITIFSYFKYKPIIEGPILEEISINNWDIIEGGSIKLTGEIKNTHSMRINQEEITINENNTFTKVFPLVPGINIISIKVENIFEKQRTYTYNIYSNINENEYLPTLQQARKDEEIKTEEKGVVGEDPIVTETD